MLQDFIVGVLIKTDGCNLKFKRSCSRLYGTIPSNLTPTYEQVPQLMRERFALDVHVSYQYFRQYVQGPIESVEDFAMELEHLSSSAFKGVSQQVASEIVVHQFTDGLRDTQRQGLVVALRTTHDLQSQMNSLMLKVHVELVRATSRETNRHRLEEAQADEQQ
ncbi:hypothetical protein CVS40_6852 [Lucilia cuprina]|nr:hypothetical protein CVS40_6852 [Lucilia cuprina]